MKEIEIFDPAMCCSTGVCGPSVDKNLLRIATLIDALKNMGIEVKRHNLSSEPQAFIHNEKVKQLLQEKGADVLPITLVGGEIAVIGQYPTTAQMSEWTGTDLTFVPVRHSSCCDEEEKSHDGGCCCGGEQNDDHGGCCCGGEHNDDHGGCCCGGEQNDDHDGCCCGGEHNDSHDGGCCCGK